MVKPADRRRVVQYWVDQGMRSERRGCRLIGVSRSTVRYQAHGPDDSELRTRLKVLAEKYPRYGYPTLHDMLRLEGLVKNPSASRCVECAHVRAAPPTSSPIAVSATTTARTKATTLATFITPSLSLAHP